MRVKEASNGATVEPNCVYVIPSKKLGNLSYLSPLKNQPAGISKWPITKVADGTGRKERVLKRINIASTLTISDAIYCQLTV